MHTTTIIIGNKLPFVGIRIPLISLIGLLKLKLMTDVCILHIVCFSFTVCTVHTMCSVCTVCVVCTVGTSFTECTACIAFTFILMQ